MEIVVTKREGQEGIDDWVMIEIDGSRAVVIGDLCECPEDATLRRDLSFVYNIPAMLQKAYKAGRRNEELCITVKDDEEEY